MHEPKNKVDVKWHHIMFRDHTDGLWQIPSDFAHRQCCRFSAQVLLRPQQHSSLKCVPQALPWLCEVRQLASAELFASCSSPPASKANLCLLSISALENSWDRFPNNDATTKLDQLWMFNLDFDTVRYGFIIIRMKVVNFIKKIFIKNHFHQKPLSSKTTFIKNHFHQKTPNPKDLNPKDLNPKP